jgi:predicted Zn-dependent peptidase
MSGRDQVRMLAYDYIALEREKAALKAKLADAEHAINDLNQVLRDAGWGQGEIDSAASVDAHIATLQTQLVQAQQDAREMAEIAAECVQRRTHKDHLSQDPYFLKAQAVMARWKEQL